MRMRVCVCARVREHRRNLRLFLTVLLSGNSSVKISSVFSIISKQVDMAAVG